jgi:hypothetical protein
MMQTRSNRKNVADLSYLCRFPLFSTTISTSRSLVGVLTLPRPSRQRVIRSLVSKKSNGSNCN